MYREGINTCSSLRYQNNGDRDDIMQHFISNLLSLLAQDTIQYYGHGMYAEC